MFYESGALDGRTMVCEMPRVELPKQFVDQLNTCENGVIDNTQAYGVAAYATANGTHRVDIFIGFELDGVTGYRNISQTHPNVTVCFVVTPDISCQADEYRFNSEEQSLIAVKVCNRTKCLAYSEKRTAPKSLF